MQKCYVFLGHCLTIFCLVCSLSANAQNLLENPGFETGVIAPWFGDNDNVVTIFEEGAPAGTYAAQGNAAQNVSLDMGVTYELRCKARIIDNEDGARRIWVGLRNSDGLVTNFELSDTAWQDVFIEFTAPTNDTYTFWIWGQGASVYASDDWELAVKGTSSINNAEARENIKVWYGAGAVVLDISQQVGDATVMIHDLSGRQVYRAEGVRGRSEISTGSFDSATGIYVVSVIAPEFHRVEKLVVSGDR